MCMRPFGIFSVGLDQSEKFYKVSSFWRLTVNTKAAIKEY